MTGLPVDNTTHHAGGDICSTAVGDYCYLDMEPGMGINGTATITSTDVKVILVTKKLLFLPTYSNEYIHTPLDELQLFTFLYLISVTI